MQKIPVGGNGCLEAALSFVSCGLSRVVRRGRRPKRGHHEDRREKSQSTVSPVILARAFICPCTFRVFLMTGSFYSHVWPTSFENVLTFDCFISIHIDAYIHAPHQQHMLLNKNPFTNISDSGLFQKDLITCLSLRHVTSFLKWARRIKMRVNY